MGSRGPKLCNVAITVIKERRKEVVELYNVPEADVKAFRQKWNDRKRKPGRKVWLMPVDGKNTDVKSFKVDMITDIKVTPC